MHTEEHSLGKIISMSSKGLKAEVKDFQNKLQHIGRIGNYVKIKDKDRTIICEISGLKQKPEELVFLNLTLVGEIIEQKFHIGVSKMPPLLANLEPIADKDLQIIFQANTYQLQLIATPEYPLTVDLGKVILFPKYNLKLNIEQFFGAHFAIFGNTGAGKSNTIASIIQKIYGDNDFVPSGSKIITIDSNSEYQQAFAKISEINPKIKVKALTFEAQNQDAKNSGDIEYLTIPVWALTPDDWAILLHVTDRNQLAVLKRAIDIANVFFSQIDPENAQDQAKIDENQDKNEENDVCDKVEIVKNHILASVILNILNGSDSSPTKSDKVRSLLATFKTSKFSPDCRLDEYLDISYGQFININRSVKYLTKFIRPDINTFFTESHTATYSIQEFYQALQFASLYEGSIASSDINEFTSILTSRMQFLIDSPIGKIFSKTSFDSFDAFIDSLLQNSNLINIDVSSLDDVTAEVIVKCLAKLILNYVKHRPQKADMPINIIIDEAHRYIHKDFARDYYIGSDIFERIAREGRKYGLLLGICSQRPGELSSTIVAQCANFILHRIHNPDDLQFIAQMVPYINQGMLETLTHLKRGDALTFGTAVPLPTLVGIPVANPTPDSANAKIGSRWYNQG